MRPSVQVVHTEADAVHAVRDLTLRGVDQEHIYVLAHEKEDTKALSELTDVNTIGAREEGAVSSVANLFRSRGDELRSKLESVGFSEHEAEYYEQELDKGHVLVITRH
ncbi:general stress protein [Paenibacillus pinihumi]|uniref:general stress protein n=1 Tax=Paenibacillus pinihumi TaxID=669462 RepID=UPI0004050926|nr:general stress protein [Paenibacillus pinihumi]